MEIGKLAPIYRLKLEINGQETDLETVTNNQRVEVRLGTDHSGELYIFVKSNGAVYKVIGCKEATSPEAGS
jgi:hypothetical protein